MEDELNNFSPLLGGESENLGTGTADDYEIPDNIKPEDIAAESQIVTDQKPVNEPKPTDSKKQAPPPPAVVTKQQENSKEKPKEKPKDKPKDKSKEKPKAVLPKKSGN